MAGRVAISAPNDAAADAGEQVARAGGNAVDAAVAAALVAMTNEVGIVSLSAGGFIAVQPASGSTPVTIDAWMDMPGRGTGLGHATPRGQGTWDVHTEYGGGVTITIGAGSVATHGALAGLGEVHDRWGRLPWSELVQPAIEVAAGGFLLGGASNFYLDYVHDTIFGWDEGSWRAIHDDAGRVRTDLVVVPHLADSLRQIAEHGPQAIRTGDLGRAISDNVLELGGLLTRQDLDEYRPVMRPSLQARMGGWMLGTNPPPAVGGVCVAAMLRLLDGHGVSDRDHIIAVQRAVLGHRLDVFDRTDDLEREAAAYLDLVDERGLALLESGSTAHVSATDSDGLAVAVTVSSGYSSGIMAKGTGIWLNNCLGEQELNPRGLHGLEPGTRLLSNMAPTVGRHVDGRTIAIGSPGADRITTAITQTLAGYVNDRLDLQAALDHPRVHVHRAGRPDEEVKVEDPRQLTMYFGGVGATLRHADGSLAAAADPRRDGSTRVV